MRVLAIIQARISSSRLPGKVMKELAGKPLLERLLERVRRCREIDKLIVATSDQPDDLAIVTLCRSLAIEVFRGNLDDVLDRFYQAASLYYPENILRLTGDCPLLDPETIDRLIRFYLQGSFDYASNCIVPTFPDGLDAEVFSYIALEKAWKQAKLASEREHVTQYIVKNKKEFQLGNLSNAEDLSGYRLTVDTEQDFKLISWIYEALYPHNPQFSISDVLRILDANPEMKQLNSHLKRNSGLEKSLAGDGTINIFRHNNNAKK